MPTLIRTLTAKDADILARSTLERTATGGRVFALGLSWKSDALRTWELEQRQRHREPLVEVRINEFDLWKVFVRPADQSLSHLMAVAIKPLYTRGLSLFEHERIQAMVKKRHTLSELARMSDQALYLLRLEYQATLSKQNDPVSRRRLEVLKDLLARKALSESDTQASQDRTEVIAAELVKPRKRGRPTLSHPSSETGSSMLAPIPSISLEPVARIKTLPTFSIPRR